MATPSASSSASNIMLAIYEKKTVSLDLYRPLRNYIIFNYSEREAQNLEDDLQTLKQLRSDLERAGPTDSLSSRSDLLQNYFKDLTAAVKSLVIIATVLVFRNPVRPLNALGSAIAIFGTFLYSQNYDAAVGDITIVTNRTRIVDFTALHGI